jgi:4-hydroxybenzoyl-CoA thioesterase
VSETFVCEVKVRFADVDHAQIVYYPRWFHYFHVAFEEFFEHAMGRTYPSVLDEEHTGYPAVRTEADYRSPARFGDIVRVHITCVRIGTRSVTLRYRAVRASDGGECVVAQVTTACVDMRTFRPADIPPHHRAFFARFLDVPA